MNTFVLNLLDRIGWTFAQALGGVGAAGQTASSLNVPITDPRAALVGGLTAAVLCGLKVLGVSVSQRAVTAATVAARVADSVPAVHNAVTKIEGTGAGSVATDVAKQVTATLARGVVAPPVSAPPAVPAVPTFPAAPAGGTPVV